MAARRNDRLWLLGGVLAIVALVAAGYLLVIKPVYDDQSNTQSAVDDAEMQLITLRKTLADLKRKSNDLPTYSAKLAAERRALPETYDVPNFVRQLQASGTAVRTDVSGFTFGVPTAVVGLSSVVGIPITLTATGSAADLARFIDRLQNVQPRAVLISSVSLNQGDDPNKTTANLTLTAFCSSLKCTTTTK